MLDLSMVTRTRLDYAIVTSAAHLTPILEAVRDCHCAFGLIAQGGKRFGLPKSKPRIAIVADDTDVALGPDGFHRGSLNRLIRDSDLAIIVSTEPTVEIYSLAAAFAAACGRHAMIVETRMERELEWLSFVRAANPRARVVASFVRMQGTA